MFMSLQPCSIRGLIYARSAPNEAENETSSKRKRGTLRQNLIRGYHDDGTALFALGVFFEAFCPRTKFE